MLKIPVGVTLEGVIAQVEGGGVAPTLQVKFTALLYPLIARTVPLNTVVCPHIDSSCAWSRSRINQNSVYRSIRQVRSKICPIHAAVARLPNVRHVKSHNGYVGRLASLVRRINRGAGNREFAGINRPSAVEPGRAVDIG